MSLARWPHQRIWKTAESLLQYCRDREWAGYDPYDGLNSRIFDSVAVLHQKFPRLVMTQLMKKSPLNLRRLLLVPKSQNPKGIALFLASCVKLAKMGLLQDKDLINGLGERLIGLSSQREGLRGWGYDFDWQALSGFAPRGTPNIVCTTFAGHALIDAYEFNGDHRFLDAAAGAAKLIRNRLCYESPGGATFLTYMPIDLDSKPVVLIHNANLLGASLLSRVARRRGDESMLELALGAMRCSLERQHGDGAWDYGESDRPSQRWIDNFHTGFNLCAIRRIGRDAGTAVFEPLILRGFVFYRDHFFTSEGAPKYYHNRLYPIDIHSAAQSIITLTTLGDLHEANLILAERVLTWTMTHLFDPAGYFYFQRHKWGVNRIPYMRWSQAWMLLALSSLLESIPEA